MAASKVPDDTRRAHIGRVISASIIGTTIEWYDFFLYGLAAALVFDQLFFPERDPLVGTMLAFATFAIGFAARPIGGLVFGHYGDKLGRKKLLVISLVLMGGSTFAMGLLPTHATVGAAAPLLLILLRLIQGFALGGEWGGAVLMVSEHGGAERRGFWASWPQAGVPVGNLLATAVLAVLASVQSDAAFLAWGWRVPFLLSGVLVVVGLWIRLVISESPVFVAAQRKAEEIKRQTGGDEQAPVVEVFRSSWREVLTAIGARFGENISYYVVTSFLVVYITTQLDLDKSMALNAVLIASVVHFVTIPLWGALSDRIGRRPVITIGALGMAVWAFAFFPVLNLESFAAITLAVTVGLLFHGAMYGPQAAYISEMFDTKVRYTGASMGAQVASIVAGSIAPLISVALLNAFDSSVPVSLYLAVASVVTAAAVLKSRETRGRDLTVDQRTTGVRGAGGAVKDAHAPGSAPVSG